MVYTGYFVGLLFFFCFCGLVVVVTLVLVLLVAVAIRITSLQQNQKNPRGKNGKKRFRFFVGAKKIGTQGKSQTAAITQRTQKTL